MCARAYTHTCSCTHSVEGSIEENHLLSRPGVATICNAPGNCAGTEVWSGVGQATSLRVSGGRRVSLVSRPFRVNHEISPFSKDAHINQQIEHSGGQQLISGTEPCRRMSHLALADASSSFWTSHSSAFSPPAPPCPALHPRPPSSSFFLISTPPAGKASSLFAPYSQASPSLPSSMYPVIWKTQSSFPPLRANQCQPSPFCQHNLNPLPAPNA